MTRLDAFHTPACRSLLPSITPERENHETETFSIGRTFEGEKTALVLGVGLFDVERGENGANIFQIQGDSIGQISTSGVQMEGKGRDDRPLTNTSDDRRSRLVSNEVENDLRFVPRAQVRIDAGRGGDARQRKRIVVARIPAIVGVDGRSSRAKPHLTINSDIVFALWVNVYSNIAATGNDEKKKHQKTHLHQI